MSKHVSYRGTTIDMDTVRRENPTVPAAGNASMNARGDKIKGGTITKTAEEMARERGREQSVLINTGLKGAMPTPPVAPVPMKQEVKEKVIKKVKEKELPSGDIVVEEDNG